jgi:hypothetical protein
MKKLALLAALAFAGAAQAGTVTYNFNNALSTTEINQTGNLAYFDTLGGTLILDSVDLFLHGNTTTNITLTSNASQSQSVKASSTVDLFFSSTPGSLIDLSLVDLSMLSTTNFVTIAPGQTKSFLNILGSASYDTGLMTGGAATSFIGSGNFSISCNSITTIGMAGGGGNVSSTQATQAGCGAIVTYNYHDAPVTPPPPSVPEPASLGLLGLGLLGLGVARRRKA